jgi:hypothetical protein
LLTAGKARIILSNYLQALILGLLGSRYECTPKRRRTAPVRTSPDLPACHDICEGPAFHSLYRAGSLGWRSTYRSGCAGVVAFALPPGRRRNASKRLRNNASINRCGRRQVRYGQRQAWVTQRTPIHRPIAPSRTFQISGASARQERVRLGGVLRVTRKRSVQTRHPSPNKARRLPRRIQNSPPVIAGRDAERTPGVPGALLPDDGQPRMPTSPSPALVPRQRASDGGILSHLCLWISQDSTCKVVLQRPAAPGIRPPAPTAQNSCNDHPTFMLNSTTNPVFRSTVLRQPLALMQPTPLA